MAQPGAQPGTQPDAVSADSGSGGCVGELGSGAAASTPSSAEGSGLSRARSLNKSKLGNYTIIKTLGEGSFGKVKLAVHSETKQKVALKIINRKTLQVSDMAGRVEREIQYLKLLRHPHIIKLYEVITTPTDIIMVIEYAGGELFDYIVQRGKMSEEEARRFFQQIICALEYCHRHKIVHRDLKPENLLLDEFLNVKIADFGLSNIMTDGNFLKTSCGSPNYAAPEVISGKLYAGPEVDVWSCGVILYVLLCGRLPFDDEFIPNLFKKINGQLLILPHARTKGVGGVYTIPNYISPGAKQLLSRMLVVDPMQRITVQEILQTNWFNVNLPTYLAPTPDGHEDMDNNNEKNEFQPDEVIVGKVAQTMGYSKGDIQSALLRTGPNDIKDAYRLVSESTQMAKSSRFADTHGMQSFLAQSPPAWNSSETIRSPCSNRQIMPFSRPGLSCHPTLQDDDSPSPFSDEIARRRSSQSRFPSTVAILPTSLPQLHRQFMKAEDINRHVQSGELTKGVKQIGLNSSRAGQSSHAQSNRKIPRWHFGIRSRSDPLEVMVEIYRALKTLGAEWAVQNIPQSDSDTESEKEEYVDDGHSDVVKNERPREKQHNRTKLDPFMIRCRWHWKPCGELEEQSGPEVLVRMDIQLYQLEASNYLVDFKCSGYSKVNLEASSGSTSRTGLGDSILANNEEITSAFPFLDVATQLITELA